MFCPECKREYREGFTECAYCHVPLAEELTEDNKPEEEPLSEEDTIRETQDLQGIELTEEMIEAIKEERKPHKRFRTARERSGDMKTSGLTLSVVGVIGIIAIILLLTGVIKTGLFGTGAYITYAVMAVLFILFTVTGFRSLSRVPSLLEEAEREEKNVEEIETWFLENFDKEKIDAAIDLKDEETSAYYARVDLIHDKLCARFVDLDPAFTDSLTEELYNRIFGEE